MMKKPFTFILISQLFLGGGPFTLEGPAPSLGAEWNTQALMLTGSQFPGKTRLKILKGTPRRESERLAAMNRILNDRLKSENEIADQLWVTYLSPFNLQPSDVIENHKFMAGPFLSHKKKRVYVLLRIRALSVFSDAGSAIPSEDQIQPLKKMGFAVPLLIQLANQHPDLYTVAAVIDALLRWKKITRPRRALLGPLVQRLLRETGDRMDTGPAAVRLSILRQLGADRESLPDADIARQQLARAIFSYEKKIHFGPMGDQKKWDEIALDSLIQESFPDYGHTIRLLYELKDTRSVDLNKATDAHLAELMLSILGALVQSERVHLDSAVVQKVRAQIARTRWTRNEEFRLQGVTLSLLVEKVGRLLFESTTDPALRQFQILLFQNVFRSIIQLDRGLAGWYKSELLMHHVHDAINHPEGVGNPETAAEYQLSVLIYAALEKGNLLKIDWAKVLQSAIDYPREIRVLSLSETAQALIWAYADPMYPTQPYRNARPIRDDLASNRWGIYVPHFRSLKDVPPEPLFSSARHRDSLKPTRQDAYDQLLSYLTAMQSRGHFSPSKYLGMVYWKWMALYNIVMRFGRGHPMTLDEVDRLVSPHYVELHVTHQCQLNCEYCRGGLRTPSNKVMPLDNVLALIDDIHHRNPRTEIRFSGTVGDPLMHPDMARILQHVIDKKMSFGITTNGIGVSRPGVAERLMHATFIQFSVDAGTAETYRTLKFSLGGKKSGGENLFEHVMANMDFLMMLRAEMVRTPEMVISFLLQSQNHHEIKTLFDRISKHGDIHYQIKMQHFHVDRAMKDEEIDWVYQKAIPSIRKANAGRRGQISVVQDEALAHEKAHGLVQIGGGSVNHTPFDRCWVAWLGSSVVSADGNHPCCEYYNGKNLPAWQNGLFSAGRRYSLEQAPHCEGCSPTDGFINSFVQFLIRLYPSYPEILEWTQEWVAHLYRMEQAERHSPVLAKAV